jgi:hypothetical protein
MLRYAYMHNMSTEVRTVNVTLMHNEPCYIINNVRHSKICVC